MSQSGELLAKSQQGLSDELACTFSEYVLHHFFLMREKHNIYCNRGWEDDQ